MSVLLYKLAHRFGVTPWERLAQFPASMQLFELLDRAERGLDPPYGSALDLGCGGGNWSMRLAARGWAVTGVDIASKALQHARERSADAGLSIRFVDGDITALQAAGVGAGYRLILDIGTVHGVPRKHHATVGQEVSAVAAHDATLVMYAFEPARRGPLPRGMSRSEIETAYSGWSVVDALAFDMSGMPESVREDNPHWYRLRRD